MLRRAPLAPAVVLCVKLSPPPSGCAGHWSRPDAAPVGDTGVMTDPMPPYSGIEGLWNADPIGLATMLFRQVFAPRYAEVLPRRGVGSLEEDLAALAGIQLPSMRMYGTPPGSTLLQLGLECVLIWERAGIAARESHGTNLNVEHQVIMLRMGTTVLQSADPEATVRRLLGR